ncbi:MAG: ADP-glyceromanno-heptose 6-epimerase [Vicinamibacteria bacterium]|nr:ADP-glyceromanno-heptose 6-epimerase [Vicinamibacteria bacterium]
MIIVTGGAGFIGSALVWGMNNRGREDVLVVDRLGHGEKWRNLVGLRFLDYRDKQAFIEELERGAYDGRVEAVLHMGACSCTTERDVDYLMENNYRYSVRLADWCARRNGVRLIYASSAATYGDGSHGYADDERRLADLRPLNAYGFSKHLFDLHALRQGWLRRMVGLKFFNVFGPNEGHKGEMRSVIAKAFPDVRDGGSMRLFKSYRVDCANGEQRRDFVYIKDVVECILFFLDHAEASGIYNVGTGESRTWNDLAHALFASLGRDAAIEYISMPESIRDRYQYETRAEISKLRGVGFSLTFSALEKAMRDYVVHHLLPGRYLAPAAANESRSLAPSLKTCTPTSRTSRLGYARVRDSSRDRQP